MSKWENGLSSPSAEQLIHLSKLLDVSLDRLSGRDEGVNATPKEEMIATIMNRLEKMNEAGVKALFDMVMLFSDREWWMESTTMEEEEAAREAQRIADEKRKQFYFDHARMFRAIESVHVPARYDLGIEEIRAIDYVCGGASRFFPEYAFSVEGMYFDYGFVKGVRWGKAGVKRKKGISVDVSREK